MNRLLIVAMGLFAVVCLTAFGEMGNSVQIMETFSVEAQPGEGTLNYVLNEKTEPVAFGQAGGNYAMGLAIPAKNLPKPYATDFKGNLMVQVAMGALKSKSADLTPQFGAATLVLAKVPTEKTRLKLLVPSGKESAFRNTGLLLFTAPSTPVNQADEEKLKGTFFANGGSLTLTPVGKAEKVSIKSGGKVYGFKRQNLSAEFDATLSTPFNPQLSKLTGTMTFPLYWPDGKEAEKLTTKIAVESLGGAGELALPTETTPKKRKPASK